MKKPTVEDRLKAEEEMFSRSCRKYGKDMVKSLFPKANVDMFYDVENGEKIPSTYMDVTIGETKWSLMYELKPYSEGLTALDIWMTSLTDAKTPVRRFHVNPVTFGSDFKASKEGKQKFEQELARWKQEVSAALKFRRDDRPVRLRDAIIYHEKRRKR